MTDPRHDQERDVTAAELALGLIEGDELAQALRLQASDPSFSAAVAAWEQRLAPLSAEVPERAPPAGLWERIEAALPAPEQSGGNVVALRRRARLWRGYGAAMTAMAASLAVVVAYRPAQEEPAIIAPAPPAEMLVASLSAPDSEAALSVAYDAQRLSLVVTPARLERAAGHDHELWIIPEGGSPVSLGLIRPGQPQRVVVPERLAPHFRARSAVALSVEPTGGSPTGQPTGPVIASGLLTTV